MNNFICKAPWVSVAFQPSGLVGPCCVYELDHLSNVASTIEDTFDEERKLFSQGQVPPGCKKCYHSFLETGQSPANGFDRYQTDFNEVKIQEINVKSNNICNLACRSCGPHFSSKWEEEFSSVITITKDSLVAEKLKLLNMNKLQKIIVAGGEPTLTQEHVDLLQHLISIDHTQVEIRISTNLTTLKYKQVDLIPLWKKFPNLVLQLSIDAVEDRAVSIRSGSDWNVIKNNIALVVSSGIQHHVNVTVSALNIWFLEETLTYLKNNCNIRNIHFGTLVGPEQLSLQVIPEKYRTELNKMLDRCIDSGYNLKQVKTYLNSSQRTELWPSFLIYNLILDHTRNEDFFGSLPIKRDLIDQWIKL